MKAKSLAVLLALAVLPADIRAEGKQDDQPGKPDAPTTQPASQTPAANPITLESTDAAGLRAAMGKLVVVRGKVTRAHFWDGGITFINLAGGFAAVCFERDLPNFPTPPDQMCAGHTVEISGTLIEHKGKPQIELVKPEQIKVIAPDPASPESPAAPKPKPKPAKPTAPARPENSIESSTFPK